MATGEDWPAVMDALLEGDRAALLKLSRLITGFLRHWRAFDFRQDWEDLVQEVLVAAVEGVREGRVENRSAIAGYIRSIAYHKFNDRLRQHVSRHEDETLPWEEEHADRNPGFFGRNPNPEVGVEVKRLLSKLPENQGEILLAVYGHGRTYEQVARDAQIPLGTLKRILRQGLARLREELSDALDEE